MEVEMQSFSGSPSNLEEPSNPKIFNVPQCIRIKDETAFSPLMASFGPYHHGKPHLRAMEPTKRRYQDKFFNRSPTRTLNECHRDIHKLINEARAYYFWDDTPALTDEEFVEMLVLDGCFILEFMLRWWDARNARSDLVLDFRWTRRHLILDLLKLENQVPFFVLRSIYGDTRNPTIEELAFDNLSAIYLRNTQWKNKRDECLEHVARSCPDGHHHLLHFLHSSIPFFNPGNDDGQKDDVMIPTAQELTEAGIKFKAKKNSNLMEVSFTDGVLEMAPLIFDDDTTNLLHNLVALEQRCPEVGSYITSYSVFLSHLIHTSIDVRLLHQAKVLENHIGSDKELAVLVNGLCKNVVFPKLPLTKLFDDVNEYCSHRWPRWRAVLVHNYFSNPWAIISLVAAVLLLLLQVGQMCFTVLTYFRNSK